MIPLSLVPKSEKVKILELRGGKGLARRFAEMGLHQGMEIEIISDSHGGPMVIRLAELHLGIGLGIANKIFVRPLSRG